MSGHHPNNVTYISCKLCMLLSQVPDRTKDSAYRVAIVVTDWVSVDLKPEKISQCTGSFETDRNFDICSWNGVVQGRCGIELCLSNLESSSVRVREGPSTDGKRTTTEKHIRHSGKYYVYQRTQGVVEMESRSADPTPQSSHTRSTDDDGATVST